MPHDLKIATAQFENRSGSKEFNLAAIDELSARAARLGANVVAFHECSITGYRFARRLSKEELWDLAEAIPGDASTAELTSIARRSGITVLAGLHAVDTSRCRVRRARSLEEPRQRSDLATRGVRRSQGAGAG